jgi:hypothetical protein
MAIEGCPGFSPFKTRPAGRKSQLRLTSQSWFHIFDATDLPYEVSNSWRHEP